MAAWYQYFIHPTGALLEASTAMRVLWIDTEAGMYACFTLVGIALATGLFIATKSAWKMPLPPKVPAVRNVDLKPWEFYAISSRELKVPLVSLSTRRPIIVISAPEAIDELLNKRSSTFSCKPRWPMAELLGRQNNVGFQYYGPNLLKSRKILHASLNAHVVRSHWSGFLHQYSLGLLKAISERPDQFFEVVHDRTQALVVRFAYGQDADPQYLALARKVMHETGVALQPGRWMVDFFPALAWLPRWFPGAGFHKWAHAARQSFIDMTQIPFQRTKYAQAAGNASESFVQHALENIRLGQVVAEEDVVMYAAGSLFSAGSETLIGTVLTCIALLAHHPDVQSRAFAEICRVVGSDRLPQLSDVSELRYIDSVIQECHRYSPAIPLVTHSNTEEDSYGGFRIPKKSWLMANVWSVLHDASVYPEPDRFIPERFLSNQESHGPPDPRNVLFGFGRRRCPGIHFANSWTFLVVSRLISIYEIVLSPDENCTLDFTTGLVPMPKPFRAEFRARAHAVDLLCGV